jgi:hypothetical protein
MKKDHVKVWNRGPITYKEEYQGQLIVIESGESIEMPRSKALHFLEQWRPFTKSGSLEGQGLKPLQIEEDPEQHAAKRDQPLIFQASDGQKFRTKIGLQRHEESLNVKPGVSSGRTKTKSA